MVDRPFDEPAAEQLLNISGRVVDDAVVVVVEGEIDVLTSPRLRAAVSDALDQADGAAIVLDLTEVTFLGSHGLAVLVEACRRPATVVSRCGSWSTTPGR